MPVPSSKAGLYFDVGLYGSPNMEAVGGVPGMRRFQKRFAANGDIVYYSAELLKVAGDNFKQRVAERFNATHGRTGETARTIATRERWRAPGGLSDPSTSYVYTVSIRGNVGYVINPIASHTITAQAAGELANSMLGPWEGRTTNFYPEFVSYWPQNPLTQVEWYQGGSNSHAPDKSWYENDEQLKAEAMADFSKIAARVAMYWGGDSATSFLGGLPVKMPVTNTFSLANAGV